MSGKLTNTIVPTVKRPQRFVPPRTVSMARARNPLLYRSGRGIDWAYNVIEAHERDQLHFAKMSDEQFAWALAKARAADYGHGGDYVEPEFESYLGTDRYGNTVTKRRDRWWNENREELLQRARENVRDWA